jgi:hypothetical protein
LAKKQQAAEDKNQIGGRSDARYIDIAGAKSHCLRKNEHSCDRSQTRPSEASATHAAKRARRFGEQPENPPYVLVLASCCSANAPEFSCGVQLAGRDSL